MPGGTFTTCDVLYFGLDRFDNSGDAQNGFWFFQKQVTTAGGTVGGGTGFTGVHTADDVLVVSDFSNGGTISTITVYTWDPACTATNKPAAFCADANLHLQASSTNANCATLPAGRRWRQGLRARQPEHDHDAVGVHRQERHPDNGALNGEFYEAGINLSALGLGGQCFSSVLSETRSSTSTTAVLKDFILGQLGSCTPALTTQVKNAAGRTPRTVSPGTPVYDTATITVTGAATPRMTRPAPWTSSSAVQRDRRARLLDRRNGCRHRQGADDNSNANTKDGISGADSDNVNTAATQLAPGLLLLPGRGGSDQLGDPGRVHQRRRPSASRVKDIVDHDDRAGLAPERHGDCQAVRRD